MKKYYASQEEYLAEQNAEKERLAQERRYGKANIHPPVYCLETETVYPSFTLAAECTGCSRWGVRRCCEGVQESTNGYHFWYEKEDLAERLINSMKFPYVEL